MNYGKATQLSTFQEGSLLGSASKSPTHHHHADASEKELTMLCQETISHQIWKITYILIDVACYTVNVVEWSSSSRCAWEPHADDVIDY